MGALGDHQAEYSLFFDAGCPVEEQPVRALSQPTGGSGDVSRW